jgi:hypothetical protein
MILELKKKHIYFKKKKIFFYYILFFKDDYIKLISREEFNSEIVNTYNCDFMVYFYFPPYEKIKEHFNSKVDYEKLIKKIKNIHFDLYNISNIDKCLEEYITVNKREFDLSFDAYKENFHKKNDT